MRFLLIAVVVIALIWHWRRRAGTARTGKAVPTKPADTPITMERCRHCGVHLAASDTVRGRLGIYCCHDHCRAAES